MTNLKVDELVFELRQWAKLIGTEPRGARDLFNRAADALDGTLNAEAQRLGLADDEMVQALNIGGRILAHKMTAQEIDDAILRVYQARLDARAGQ